MKRLLIYALLFIAIGSTSAQAQNCPNEYWGTKTIYEPQQKKYTPAPAGYIPVYVNHVGRHGARHLTKDVALSLAYAILQQADSANALTTQGKQLKAMVMLLQKEEKGSLKFISIRGAEEQRGIGRRMAANYSAIFSEKKKLNVAITKEERTRQSADAFLTGLNYASKPDFVINNDELRFFSITPAYAEFEESGSWKKYYHELEKAIKPAGFNIEIMDRFFAKSFTKKFSDDQQAKFVDDIFGFSSVTNSIQKEIVNLGYKAADFDFRKLITCPELKILDELNSADDFLKKSSGMDKNGIQVRDAAPLLVSFINTTDSYITGNNVAANLRFAHAETIAPIAALMDISIADKTTTKILDYQKVWSAAKIIPLSSNIQWILYKNAQGKYRVKIMLNEQEVAIDGVNTKSFPYYKWEDIRKHYMDKLAAMHIKLSDDMHAYLINLK